MTAGPSSTGRERPEDTRVLAGLRVVEMSIAVAAPSCGRMLAYHGAEVIKVEALSNPDVARLFGSAWARDPELADVFRDTSPYLPEMSAGKRSIGLELKKPGAREVMERLVATADVFLTNYASQAIAELRLSHGDLETINPGLIYAGMSGFGADPELPYYPFRAFGPNQAPLVGLDELTGYPDQEPAGIASIAPPDYIGGLHAALAILTALEHRDATGEGSFIDLSQLETTVAFLGPWLIGQDLGVPAPQRNGSRLPWAAPCGVYRAAGHDSFLAISVEDDASFAGLRTLVDVDPIESTGADLSGLEGRLAAHDALDNAVTAWTTTRSAAQAAAELQAVGVAAHPVLDHRGVLRDPQLQDRRFYDVEPSSRLGRDLFTGHPLRLSETPARVDRAGPNMGEDSRAVMEELGYDEEAVEALIEAGALFVDARPELRLERPFDKFYEALGFVTEES